MNKEELDEKISEFEFILRQLYNLTTIVETMKNNLEHDLGELEANK